MDSNEDNGFLESSVYFLFPPSLTPFVLSFLFVWSTDKLIHYQILTHAFFQVELERIFTSFSNFLVAHLQINVNIYSSHLLWYLFLSIYLVFCLGKKKKVREEKENAWKIWTPETSALVTYLLVRSVWGL